MCCGFDNDYIHDCEQGKPPAHDIKRVSKKVIALLIVVAILTVMMIVMTVTQRMSW